MDISLESLFPIIFIVLFILARFFLARRKKEAQYPVPQSESLDDDDDEVRPLPPREAILSPRPDLAANKIAPFSPLPSSADLLGAAPPVLKTPPVQPVAAGGSGGLAAVASRPPLQQGFIYAEILGPPRSLRAVDG